MPNESRTEVRVDFTPEVKRNVRALARKYRHIYSDLQPILDQLEAGEIIGDRVPGTGHAIFKVRVQNTDIRKGKRSGYRLIYYLKLPSNIILLTVYSKLEQADISAEKIRRILKEFETQ